MGKKTRRRRKNSAGGARPGGAATGAIATDAIAAAGVRQALATDAAWRGEVAALTREGKSKVYEDARPLRDLEKILKEACGAGAGGGP